MDEYCMCWDNHGGSCEGCGYKPASGRESGVLSDFTWTRECADVHHANNAPYENRRLFEDERMPC